MSKQAPKAECRHPEGPEAYHKVVLNVNHATKARLERALCFYTQGDIDRDTAIGALLDDARAGAQIRAELKAEAGKRSAVEMLLDTFPGSQVIR